MFGDCCPGDDLEAKASAKVGGGVEFSGTRSGRLPVVPGKRKVKRSYQYCGRHL